MLALLSIKKIDISYMRPVILVIMLCHFPSILGHNEYRTFFGLAFFGIVTFSLKIYLLMKTA